MNGKKRILLFNLAVDEDDPILGFAVPFIARLARDAENISIITVRTGHYQLPPNVAVYSVLRERGASKIRAIFLFYRHLFAVLKNGRFDVCFSHMCPLFTLLAGPFLFFKKIPSILWYSHRRRGIIARLAYFFADKIITSSKEGYEVNPSKVRITGQMVDTDFFNFMPDGAHSEPPLFISVGRIAPIKDLMTFVRAAAMLRDAGHTFRCALVGPVLPHDVAYYSLLQEEIRRLLLTEIFSFRGSVPHARMPALYHGASAHINLCPTGALDKAALEAMACGTPSIFANKSFLPLAGPHALSLHFNYGDPDSLAIILARTISLSSAYSRAMKNHMRETVVHGHGLESFVRHFNDLIA